MGAWARWLLGVDASPGWASGGDWHFEFNAVPEGAWAPVSALAALGALAGVWYLYRREQRELPRPARLLLCSLRLLGLGCVAFMMLEMVVVLTNREHVPSQLPILLDASESMSLVDPYTQEQFGRAAAERTGLVTEDGSPDLDGLRKQTRMELARLALLKIVPQLADGRILSPYGFASSLQPLEEPGGLQSLTASGIGTGIGDAIKNVLAAHRGQPLAGLLLVSDGQSNTGEDAVKVAERAGKDGVPVYSLAVGTPEGPRNARLAELQVNPVVFVRDPIELGVLVESRGLQGATASVTLEQRRDGGAWEEIGRELITLGEDAILNRSTFRFVPESTGDLDFRAQVLDVGPELTDSDNVAAQSVRVIRQKIRVLLIAGGPSNEVQFLRNALLRDTALEFSSWLQSAGEGFEHVGHRPIRRLPSTQAELDRFDVLILFDPDMRKLSGVWPDMLTKFVGQAGGGLVFVAGEQYSQQLFSPSFSEDSAGIDNAWLKILPVVRDPGLYQSTADVRLSSRESYTLELTPEGREDPVFRFSPDSSRNREILSSLPGMFWHFPVTRAKPGATVLARHGDPRMTNSYGRHVMMATQLYGPGRSIFIAFDSTYRWRYLAEEHFDGFWARLVDRVGRSKLLGGRYPFTLSTDKSAYRLGDSVTITARFNNPSDLAGALAGLAGEMEVAGQPAHPLAFDPVPEDPGTFQTSFLANEPGPYQVRVLPSAESEPDSGPRAATLSFRVEPARQELDHASWNRALLDSLANASGGKAFTLAELDQVADAFQIRQVERVLEFRDEVWDAPLVYGALMALLTAEWLLRKRYRMA